LDQKKSLRVGSESTWVEGRSASYLLQVKSKLGLGQGPSLAQRLPELFLRFKLTTTL